MHPVFSLAGFTKTIACFLLLFFHSNFVYSGSEKDSTISVTFLPAKKLVPVFTADQRAYRLSIANRLGSNDFIGGIGGHFRIAEVKHRHHLVQFSIASNVYNTLTRYLKAGTLVNADFYVDLFLDVKLTNSWLIRTGAGHTSHHLSDDVVMKYNGINYVRDYYHIYGIYKPETDKWFVYSGLVYNHNFKTTEGTQAFDISGKPLIQAGFSQQVLATGRRSHWYWAGDIKLRGELDYGTTQNLQTGILFTGASESALRLAFSWSSGYEERGQFYKQKTNFTTLGLYFEY